MNLQRTMQRFARWHIWLGWAVALPILMWTITGLVMVARPLEVVRGDALHAKPAAIDPAKVVLPKLRAPVESIELLPNVNGGLWIVTEAGGGHYRYSARTGSALPPVIENEARTTARAAYLGEARLEKVAYFPADAAPWDLRRKVDVWQARFSDGTHLYIDATTGEVIGLRTGWWRVYDFLYSLHVMDPQDENAHNPLIALFGVLTLGGAVLGTVLLFRRRKARVKA